MESRFGNKYIEQLHRPMRKQNQDKKLQHLIGKISKLIRLTYPTVPDNVLEDMAFQFQMFTEGARDTELHQYLKLFKAKNMGAISAYGN